MSAPWYKMDWWKRPKCKCGHMPLRHATTSLQDFDGWCHSKKCNCMNYRPQGELS